MRKMRLGLVKRIRFDVKTRKIPKELKGDENKSTMRINNAHISRSLGDVFCRIRHAHGVCLKTLVRLHNDPVQKA